MSSGLPIETTTTIRRVPFMRIARWVVIGLSLLYIGGCVGRTPAKPASPAEPTKRLLVVPSQAPAPVPG